MSSKKSCNAAEKYLRDLQEKIMRFIPSKRCGGKVGYMLVSRSLTRKEWRDVKRFVGMHEFPCTIDAGQFMTALHVFSHNDSFAPAKPPCIFYVEGRHLPDVRPRTEAPTGYARRTKEFLALTHTKRNKELLKFYGIDELEPASYYLRNAL